MNTDKIKKDFRILSRKINGKKVTYLDNAATTQRPKQVIEAMTEFYDEYNANIHRGVYKFSEEATEHYEGAREKVAEFIGASEQEIVFTRNATEAINLVAYAWGEENITKGDKIVISIMEHHSNFVPWQQLAARKKAKLEIIDIKDDYELNESQFEKIAGAKLIAISHVSNAIGTINDVDEICKIAKETGAISLVDGAQSVPHMKTDVKRMDCDFLAFSGHKMLGPTGIGMMYGKQDMLEKMKPFLFGGDMIREVHVDRSEWNNLPYKFEAGTPNIAGAIGLGAAVDYLSRIGMSEIRKHEMKLTKYAVKRLSEIDDVKQYGTTDFSKRAGIASFNMKGIHPHDIASLLDECGVAIRSGHHCAMPLHTRLGLDSSNRASFYIYNDETDVDRLIGALEYAKKTFGAIL
jgi:cysteine desulfurase/selenocysteine lyase